MATQVKLEDFAKVREARATLVRAQLDLAAAEAEVELVLRPVDAPSRSSRTDAAAASYLRGEDPQPERAPIPFLPDELRERRRVLRRAVELATDEVTRAEYEASRQVCDALRADYFDHVSALTKALIAAGQAADALEAFTQRLADEGIRWNSHLPPMPFEPVTHGKDRNSRLAVWLSEAAEYGFIKAGDLPNSWADAWARPFSWERDRDRARVASPRPKPPLRERITNVVRRRRVVSVGASPEGIREYFDDGTSALMHAVEVGVKED